MEERNVKECWMSPYGEIIWCKYGHPPMAFKLILERYNSGRYKNISEVEEKIIDPIEFLELLGWIRCSKMEMSNHGWAVGNFKHLSTDQRNKLFDLTGKYFDE